MRTEVAAQDILPPAYLQSTYFDIAEEIRAADNFYHFEVVTDFGTYRVSSLAMLYVRIHEIITIAEANRRLQDTGVRLNRAPAGRRGVESEQVVDILSDPLGTASKLLGNLRYNLDQTLSQRIDDADPAVKSGEPLDYADPGPHKRSAAADLRVDVYSRNRELQNLLRTLASARSAGRLRDSLTPRHANKFVTRTFGGGGLDARLQSMVKNTGAAALNAEIDRQLAGLGVEKATRVALLTNPAYTPRSLLYFASYLQILGGTESLSAVAAAATAASTEVDAVAYVNFARMLAYYHLSEAKLAAVITRGTHPILRSAAGRVVIALPIDYLAWTENAAAILEFRENMESQPGITGFTVLLAGQSSARARDVFAARNIRIEDRFSF